MSLNHKKQEEHDIMIMQKLGWIDHKGAYTREGLQEFKKILEVNIEESNSLRLVEKIQGKMGNNARNLLDQIEK